MPEQWVVQVAAFDTDAKAEKLSSELRAIGYRSFVYKYKKNENVWFRVYVGPALQRERAAALKAELDQHLSVNAMIRKYTVQDNTGVLN